MSHGFFQLIQSGSTAKVADAVRDDPSLARLRDAAGVSSLLWSVYSGQPLIRDFLLTELAHQCVPLDIFEAAAIHGTARLEALLDAEPEDVNAYSADGWTPLHLAAAFAGPDSVKLLLAAGADVNAVSTTGETPLHYGAQASDDIVRFLVQSGAKIDVKDKRGRTPVEMALGVGLRGHAGGPPTVREGTAKLLRELLNAQHPASTASTP